MNNKKYAQLDGLTAVYDEKTNSVSIIGKGLDYPRGFKIRLKPGSSEDLDLRKILFQDEITSLKFDEPNYYPENTPPRMNQIPLGLDASGKEIFWDVDPSKNNPSTLFISGLTGSGKTNFLTHIYELLIKHCKNQAEMLFFSENFAESHKKKNIIIDYLDKLLDGTYERDIDKPLFLLYDYIDPSLKERLEKLILTARSKNIYVVLTGYSIKAIGNAKNACQEIFINRQWDSEEYEFRCYGIKVDAEKTSVFVPYLPQMSNYEMSAIQRVVYMN